MILKDVSLCDMILHGPSACSGVNDRRLLIPQVLVGASFRTRWPCYMTSEASRALLGPLRDPKSPG